MAPVRINGWVLAHINMTSLAQVMQYTWSYRTSSNVVSPAQLNDFCQQLYTLISVAWKTIHTDDTQLVNVTAESNYPIVPNYTGVFTPPALWTGTDASDPVPLNVALAFALKTGVRGRAFQGRTYLGGVGENVVTGNNFTATYGAAAALFIAQHLIAINSLGIVYSPSIASRAGHVMTDINSASANFQADSQRRRLTGRGR